MNIKAFRQLVLAVGMALFLVLPQVALAQTQVFTLEELKKFDGLDGRPAYAAYEGKVYDFTSSKLWKLGQHFGLQAGNDLTDKMAEAPHGAELLKPFPVVGVLADDSNQAVGSVQPSEENEKSSSSLLVEENSATSAAPATSPWYQGRLKVLGLSILGWTGILLGVLFVLTFGTCFALPWSKLPVPWRGKKPGPDALDVAEKHQPLTSTHHYFVWLTIVVGIIHGVIGFLQMMGIYL